MSFRVLQLFPHFFRAFLWIVFCRLLILNFSLVLFFALCHSCIDYLSISCCRRSVLCIQYVLKCPCLIFLLTLFWCVVCCDISLFRSHLCCVFVGCGLIRLSFFLYRFVCGKVNSVCCLAFKLDFLIFCSMRLSYFGRACFGGILFYIFADQ